MSVERGFANVNAPNVEGERQAFWAKLLDLLKSWNIIWCVGGDFNVVKWVDEWTDNNKSMSHFSHFIKEFILINLPLAGGRYTRYSFWENVTFNKLDQFLVVMEIVENFLGLSQISLPCSLFDHKPVMLCSNECNWDPKPFRFFNFWLEEASFKDMFAKAWRNTENLSSRQTIH